MVLRSSTNSEMARVADAAWPTGDSHRVTAERTSGTRWIWPIAVLALCHAQAIASFQILNILIDPIKTSLTISDTEFSLLQGLAVAIFAALLGIPAARWADRRSRRNVILVGACGWSLATLGCAFVTDFGQLFTARIFMGVGEVFLFPAALSLIADLVPRERLSSAVAAFGSGGPVGAAAALFGGSWILPHRAELVSRLPALSRLEGWQVAFLLCGLTGLVTAALLLTVQEPPHRHQQTAADSSFAAIRDWVVTHWRGYASVSGAMLCLALCAFATAAWAPTVLTRVHGVPLQEAGRLTAGAALIGGVLLAYPCGLWVDSLHRVGRSDGVLLVSTLLAVGLASLAGLAVTATVTGVAAGAWVGLYALLGLPTVLAGTALPMMTPSAMRAQIMALHLLLMNMLALSLGPFVVAVVTDKVFGRPTAVGNSLACVDALASGLAAYLLLTGRRAFKSAESHLGLCNQWDETARM
jgi:predicted MFS family arabinose efflux permease